MLSYANVGATSLFTTAEDLAKWSNNLDNGEVGGERVIEQVLTRAVLNSGDTVGYAFGLGIGTYKGLPTVSHTGGDAGFRSVLMKFPEQDFAVAILSNHGAFNPGGMGQLVANIYLEEEIAEAEAALAAASSEEPSAEPAEEATPTAAFDPDNVELEQYVGVFYSPELETMYTLVVEEDQLVARHIRHEPATLRPEAADRFRGNQFYLSQVQFERDAEGEIVALRVSNGRVRNLLFEKREP